MSPRIWGNADWCNPMVVLHANFRKGTSPGFGPKDAKESERQGATAATLSPQRWQS